MENVKNNYLNNNMTENWKQDYAENFCNNTHHLELLENGPKSLSQSWLLQALYNDWKKIRGIKDPPSRESGDQTTMKEWLKTYEKN